MVNLFNKAEQVRILAHTADLFNRVLHFENFLKKFLRKFYLFYLIILNVHLICTIISCNLIVFTGFSKVQESGKLQKTKGKMLDLGKSIKIWFFCVPGVRRQPAFILSQHQRAIPNKQILQSRLPLYQVLEVFYQF